MERVLSERSSHAHALSRVSRGILGEGEFSVSRARSAFTLIGLLVVIAVIAILAALLPSDAQN